MDTQNNKGGSDAAGTTQEHSAKDREKLLSRIRKLYAMSREGVLPWLFYTTASA